MTPKTQKLLTPILLATAVTVAGTFLLLQKKPPSPSTAVPASGPAGTTESSASIRLEPSKESPTERAPTTSAAKKIAVAPIVQESATPVVQKSETPPAEKPSCWVGSFRLAVDSLARAQRETFGERDQLFALAQLEEAFPRWKTQNLCVRSNGKTVNFEREGQGGATIRVRSGSGRIQLTSSIEVSYCESARRAGASTACRPCVVEKDSFESSLFGEPTEDSAQNEQADISAQLSPEVRRELARLEREKGPAPISAWQLSRSESAGKSACTAGTQVAQNR